MKEFAVLGVVVILIFIGFVIYWNKKWENKVVDEREVLIRLKVRELISKAVEIALIAGIIFHIQVQPLTGVQVFILIGIPGVLAEAFGNWYLRRDAV